MVIKLGYVRVSTKEQKVDLQFDALKAAGCVEIYSDKISGAKFERPGLGKLIEYARAGDNVKESISKVCMKI